MANSMMEELEIKEPTPSLAPSQYESPLYTKKWRIVLAVLLGVTLMGLCILGFYVSVKARGAHHSEISVEELTTTTQPPRISIAGWRTSPSGASCLSLVNDTCRKEFAKPPLLVLGLDGLKPDALREDLTPALVYLRKCGATTRTLVPTYPTTTFPNLYTIATGLYPESHGIIANRMQDPTIAKEFVLTDNDVIVDPAWWGGEPIWNTVTKQRLKSATLYWPGSDVTIQGGYAPYWKSYLTHLTFEERINQIHYWLNLPEHERPHLIMAYFEEPMRTIREFGVDSKEAEEQLANVDKMIDELMNFLHQQELAHCLNVMVVSDHGVAPSSCKDNFHVKSFEDDIEKKADIYTGAVGRLRAKERDVKVEADILNSLMCKNPRVRALPKDLFPRRYHYANNERIENVLLDTSLNTWLVTNSDKSCRKAAHGYNNLEASMQALFIGFGPDFKVNETTQSFRNVELYNLMCQLMRITPSTNNGTIGSLNHLLRHPTPVTPSSKPASLPEQVLPPPDGMLEHRNPGDTCHCFTPEAEDTPVVESLVRARRSEGNTSNDTNIDNTATADTSDNHNNSINNNPDTTTTTTSTTTTPSSTTTPTTTTTSSTTTTSTTTTPTTNTTTPSTTTTTTTPTTTTTTTTPIPTTTPRSRTQAELSLLFNTHVPWGSPGLSLQEDIKGNLKILLHSSHVIGLHETLNLGVWTSFTLTNLTVTRVNEEASVEEQQHLPACWRADPRLERPHQDQCQRMLTQEAFDADNITLVQLFPQELDTKELLEAEGYLLSNMAAVKAGYLAGAYQAMVKAMKGWTTSLGAINVIHGPIFDHDIDGHQDPVAIVLNKVKPLVPSNYFFVISQCESVPCPAKPKATLAFIFPNTQLNDNCLMNDIEYLNYHLANVRDVELLTGLHFFKNVYGHAAVEYRTMQPLTLWPLPSSPILSMLSDRMGKADSFAVDNKELS